MRVFLISCLAVVVLAVGAFLTLNAVQKPTGTRFTTEGARINPNWTFRQMFTRAKTGPKTVAMAVPTSDNVAEGECDVSSAWSLILADFSSSPTADPACEH
jgi:hypothetical protein